jgi:hypothetical protein
MRMQNLTKLFTFLFVLVLAGACVQTASAQAKKKKVVYYSVKAGTVFRVRIDESLNSKTARAGDTFKTTTRDPIYSSGGVVLIPAGSTIYGRVASATPAAKDGKPGNIDVRFTSLKLPNGRKATISGMLTDLDSKGTSSDNEGGASAKKTSHRNAKFIGGGAAGGLIIGGIAGGGKGAAIGAGVGAVGGFIGKKMLKGPEAEVKSGTEFGVYLNRAISLPRYSGHAQ